MGDITSIISDPTTLTVTGILLLIVAAFGKEVVIAGTAHRRMEANFEKRLIEQSTMYEKRLTALESERNEYKAMVLSLLEVTDRTLKAKGVPSVERP
jgi:hypothetical protein